MNIRPSDIDLLSRVFQAFDSAPVAFFAKCTVRQNRPAQKRSPRTARKVPLQLWLVYLD